MKTFCGTLAATLLVTAGCASAPRPVNPVDAMYGGDLTTPAAVDTAAPAAHGFAAQPARAELRHQSVFVDELAAPHVDQEGAVLHARQRVRVHQPARLVRLRRT